MLKIFEFDDEKKTTAGEREGVKQPQTSSVLTNRYLSWVLKEEGRRNASPVIIVGVFTLSASEREMFPE